MIVILISSTQQREWRRSGNLCHQSSRFVRCSLQNSQRAIVFLRFPAGKSGLRHAAWRITESRAVLRADAGLYRLHKLNAVAFTFGESHRTVSRLASIDVGGLSDKSLFHRRRNILFSKTSAKVKIHVGNKGKVGHRMCPLLASNTHAIIQMKF